MATIRTTHYYYPQEELCAMEQFYGGKQCVIQKMSRGGVQWTHILDPNPPKNDRLSQMLVRNLRRDRHPRHAAEVRENLVPVKTEHHLAMNDYSPRSTLFLHEDIIARTLDYELDLQRWRVTELEAGRGDPGRPTYQEVFGDTWITPHRYHAAALDDFVRIEGNKPVVISSKSCPGIGNTPPEREMPIIDTLLSIPFSLLHTVPRLAGIVPISTYQQKLVAMGHEIIRLWWWDPSPDMITKSESTIATNQKRNPKPKSISHPSRIHTTFTYHTSNTNNTHDSELSLILPQSISPSLSQGKGMPLLITWNTGLAEQDDLQDEDQLESITSDTESAPLANWDDQIIEDGQDIKESISVYLSDLDITLWCNSVATSDPVVQTCRLIPDSFTRGIIGGLSANDILMIKGLIDPLVYIQFYDLSSFSGL